MAIDMTHDMPSNSVSDMIEELRQVCAKYEAHLVDPIFSMESDSQDVMVDQFDLNPGRTCPIGVIAPRHTDKKTLRFDVTLTTVTIGDPNKFMKLGPPVGGGY